MKNEKLFVIVTAIALKSDIFDKSVGYMVANNNNC